MDKVTVYKENSLFYRENSMFTLVTSVGRHWRLVNGSALAFFISATSRLLASTAYSRLRIRFLWFIALHNSQQQTHILAVKSNMTLNNFIYSLLHTCKKWPLTLSDLDHYYSNYYRHSSSSLLANSILMTDGKRPYLSLSSKPCGPWSSRTEGHHRLSSAR